MNETVMERLQIVKEKYALVASSLETLQINRPDLVSFVLLDRYCDHLGMELRHVLEDWKTLQKEVLGE